VLLGPQHPASGVHETALADALLSVRYGQEGVIFPVPYVGGAGALDASDEARAHFEILRQGGSDPLCSVVVDYTQMYWTAQLLRAARSSGLQYFGAEAASDILVPSHADDSALAHAERRLAEVVVTLDACDALFDECFTAFRERVAGALLRRGETSPERARRRLRSQLDLQESGMCRSTLLSTRERQRLAERKADLTRTIAELTGAAARAGAASLLRSPAPPGRPPPQQRRYDGPPRQPLPHEPPPEGSRPQAPAQQPPRPPPRSTGGGRRS